MNPIHLLLQLLKNAASVLIALLVLFEEWGWEPLKKLLAWVSRLPVLRQLERWIVSLPPYAALAVLLVPSLLLLPVKLLALGLMARGMVLAGGMVIVAAKLVGTALVAYLFGLTQPALMRLAWFEHIYQRWTGWKTYWLAQVRQSWAWRFGRVLKRRVRERWQQWRTSWGIGR